jgi:hypothetical protein
MLIHDYKLSLASITRTNSTKTWKYFLILNFISITSSSTFSSHCIKLLGLVHSITFSYSFLECIHICISFVLSLGWSLNTYLLVDIQLILLTPTEWSASSRGLRHSVLIVYFRRSIIGIHLEQLKLQVRGCTTSTDSLLLFIFTLVPNSALLSWKLLVFEFLLGNQRLCLVQCLLLE